MSKVDAPFDTAPLWVGANTDFIPRYLYRCTKFRAFATAISGSDFQLKSILSSVCCSSINAALHVLKLEGVSARWDAFISSQPAARCENRILGCLNRGGLHV